MLWVQAVALHDDRIKHVIRNGACAASTSLHRRGRRAAADVIITGAGRGIGAATALAAAQRGYAARVDFRNNRAAAEGVVRSIEAAGDAQSRNTSTTRPRKGPWTP